MCGKIRQGGVFTIGMLFGVERVRRVVKVAIAWSQPEEFRVVFRAIDVRPKWPDRSRRCAPAPGSRSAVPGGFGGPPGTVMAARTAGGVSALPAPGPGARSRTGPGMAYRPLGRLYWPGEIGAASKVSLDIS